MMHRSYLGLHHVRSVQPQVKNGAVDVQRIPVVELLQDSVQNDEGSGATHAGAETPDSSQRTSNSPILKVCFLLGSDWSLDLQLPFNLRVFLPAVDHGGTRTRTPVDVVSDGSDELDERPGVLWDSVVGPDRVVKLPNKATEAQLLLLNTQGHKN